MQSLIRQQAEDAHALRIAEIARKLLYDGRINVLVATEQAAGSATCACDGRNACRTADHPSPQHHSEPKLLIEAGKKTKRSTSISIFREQCHLNPRQRKYKKVSSFTSTPYQNRSFSKVVQKKKKRIHYTGIFVPRGQRVSKAQAGRKQASLASTPFGIMTFHQNKKTTTPVFLSPKGAGPSKGQAVSSALPHLSYSQRLLTSPLLPSTPY